MTWEKHEYLKELAKLFFAAKRRHTFRRQRRANLHTAR
jgi:hypothetical protein